MRVRARARDPDECEHGPPEGDHRVEHALPSHAESVRPPGAAVIAAQVEIDFPPRVDAISTVRPMTARWPLRSFEDMHETVISVQGLTKRYGDVEAVRGVDLDIRRGEIFAFL